MRAYFKIPELYRKVAIRDAAEIVDRVIQRCSAVRLVPHNVDLDEDRDDEFPRRTIYSFTVKGPRSPFTMAKCKVLYRALNVDVSNLLRVRGNDAKVAATQCHIGQPVALSNGEDAEVGALRISVDARMLARLWSEREISVGPSQQHRLSSDVQIVLDKLQLLVEQFDRVENSFGDEI
jgi:hypothetical protein